MKLVVKLTLVVASVLACGCPSDPLCDEADPIATTTASNVQLEVRGANRAGLPVLIQDRTGAIIEEGTTDGDGVYVVDSAPSDAALSVELEPDSGQSAIRLVTYLGLESDDILVLELRPYRESEDRASVTVRFQQLDAPGVYQYWPDLGANCGAASPIPHDASEPNRIHEVTLEARCFGAPGRAVVTASSLEDGSFVGVASASLDLQPDDDLTVDLGPWETATSELRFVGEYPPDARGLVSPTWGGVVVSTDQVPVAGGSSVTIPNAPNSFDGVKIQVPGPHGILEVHRSTLDSYEVDSADFPPPIDAIEVTDLEDGAPRVAWRYEGDAAAAVAFFGSDSSGDSIQRYAIRGGNPCHIQFPPLPARYAHLVPAIERELTGGVFLLSGPTLDPSTARGRVGPIVNLVPDLPVFSVGASVSVDNYPPDPS